MVLISGGKNKQDFPMKPGVLTHGRMHLLLNKEHYCYRLREPERGCASLFADALWMPI